jgi:hAT family C-terminal dimerisation region
MALDILSIPAMSDEPERVFSGARHTVSWERSQIDVQTLKHIEYLKHWKQSGILNEFLDKE